MAHLVDTSDPLLNMFYSLCYRPATEWIVNVFVYCIFRLRLRMFIFIFFVFVEFFFAVVVGPGMVGVCDQMRATFAKNIINQSDLSAYCEGYLLTHLCNAQHRTWFGLFG